MNGGGLEVNMRCIHKKALAIILVILLCFIDSGIYMNKVLANNSDRYLVLVEQKNGSWKEYTGIIELSDNGYLMIKAKRIAKALGYTYNKNDNGTFEVKKENEIYNTYHKNDKEYIYSDGIEGITKLSPEKAYNSKLSEYNLCQVSTLGTLVYYKCFSSIGIADYSSFDGIICFSKYKDIAESVPLIELKPAIVHTKATESNETMVNIEGIEFPVRTEFLKKNKALSDWGGLALIWGELEHEVDSKIIESTNLDVTSDKIEFTHLGLGSDGISLTKTSKGYKLAISVKLKGSIVSDQNAQIVKAMVTTISSKPLEVYSSIFDSFTTNDTHGINEDDYVAIGDCKLKVNMSNGVVTYYIRENN